MLHIFYKHLFGKDTAMKLINYSLKVGKKKLLENVNISFDKKYINHILGSNGAGKSSFAKTCVGMLEFEGKIEENQEAILHSSLEPLIFILAHIIQFGDQVVHPGWHTRPAGHRGRPHSNRSP